MAVVTLSINDRLYEIACDESQVATVQERAQDLDDRVRLLAQQLGMQPEGRMLVMAGLMLADELHEARLALHQVGEDMASAMDGDARLADEIGRMAERIDAIAERLERS